MHYIPLVDPGISGSELPGTYPPYDEGMKDRIFIMDSKGVRPFIGKVSFIITCKINSSQSTNINLKSK